MRRKVVQEEGHRIVHVRRPDDVVVIEHQHPHLPRGQLPGTGDVVDQRGQRSGAGRSLQGLDESRVDAQTDTVEGRRQVIHQASQVVVRVVQGQPPNPGVWLALSQIGEPVAEHGGLSEPSRCRYESEPVAGIGSCPVAR